MSLPRRAGPRRGRREDPPQERKQGLASRSRGDLPAPWGGAASDADTLAIADEAAASGRRPGAAAVRRGRCANGPEEFARATVGRRRRILTVFVASSQKKRSSRSIRALWSHD